MGLFLLAFVAIAGLFYFALAKTAKVHDDSGCVIAFPNATGQIVMLYAEDERRAA